MLEFLFELFFTFLFGFTGHMILWALSLGSYNVSSGSDTTATVVGIAFWVAVAVGVWFAFFR